MGGPAPTVVHTRTGGGDDDDDNDNDDMDGTMGADVASVNA
jgi:hypothetical protein